MFEDTELSIVVVLLYSNEEARPHVNTSEVIMELLYR